MIFFDLGDTLIRQRVDSEAPLDTLPLDLLPHTIDVLKVAARSCALGLITNTERSDEAAVRRALRSLAIEHFFRTVTTSVDVGDKKPHPGPFVAALQKHDAPASSALMIGNSYAEDVVPARRLGMTTILLSDEPGDYQLADEVLPATDRVPLLQRMEALCRS